ncbi:TPM domain-containing protein [Limibacterium fermenti]|uniref:TPM domain-containing protein n=1 Tax=Limibacterium fermenti TaxID=3229863 RepID=UPI000E9055CC|nr:hypothetical protein [Porphyromonadaceae bacterium]HBX45500.1 hypothetical protein [Porphyromonadaceae bacterium]
MLKKQALEQISAAIRAAEKQTSGEIRVCIAASCKGEPLDAAAAKFRSLKMHVTQWHNSVLIYVSPTDHKAAIVGDSGINRIATEGFWEETLQEMLLFFRQDKIVEGICRAVEKTGELIRVAFPVEKDDINELSDEVIIEE